MVFSKRLAVVALLALLALALAGCGPKYTLRVVCDTAAGTVTLSPPGGSYKPDTLVTAHVSVNPGYEFTGWEGDVPVGHETDIDLKIRMDGNKSITATFVQLYDLTLTCNPQNGGTVNIEDITPRSYQAGTVLRLTAQPADKYAFTGWSGDASGSEPVIELTMDGHKDITASFEYLVPTAPANLRAVGSLNKITLYWDESQGPVEHYVIYRSANGADPVERATVAAGSTAYEDAMSPADDGVYYTYQVRAVAGAEQSELSNAAGAMRGTPLTGAAGDFNIGDGSPFVINGNATFHGNLTVAAGTKLFVTPGSTLHFTKSDDAAVFKVEGLLRMVGTAAKPIIIRGDAQVGFQLKLSGATDYGAGSGTLLEYVGLDGVGNPNLYLPIEIEDCSPRLHQVKLLSRSAQCIPNIRLASGAIVDHCSLDGLGLLIEGNLSGTPLSVTYSTFGGAYRCIELWGSSVPHVGVGQISNNSFGRRNPIGGDVYVLNNGSGSGTIDLSGNFWHAAGIRIDPFINYTTTPPPPSGMIATVEPVLTEAPPGVGANW